MSDPRVRQRLAEMAGRAPTVSPMRALAEAQQVEAKPARKDEPAPDAPGTLNLAAVREQHRGDLFALLLWLDGMLVSKGFPAISPWWLSFLRAFYASGKRWAVVMAGRGAGKSTVLTRVAVVEALFGERKIPPGQRWIWPFISVGVPDARRRILEIQAILTAIGVMEQDKKGEWWPLQPSYPQGVPTIETQDAGGNDIAFVALAGTIAGVSGPSSIGATIDEEAKLRDKATNANPATEILASLVQTFRARPGIRAIRCSSAWEEDGSHHASIKAGTNAVNHVAAIGAEFLPAVLAGHVEVAAWEAARGNAKGAEQVRAFAAGLTADSPNVPTWLGNPTITALASRIEVEALPPSALEGLDPVAWWLRENGSKPQPVGGGALALGGVDMLTDERPFAPVDTVLGVAPSIDGSIVGMVAVGIDASGRMRVVGDWSGAMGGRDIAAATYGEHRFSVLACHTAHVPLLAAELAAAYAGGGMPLAPVAGTDVYDGSALRVGPLRTAYDRGRLTHAPGLDALEADLRRFNGSARSPRVEALAVAVARLVACYPHLGAHEGEPEPIRGTRLVEAMLVGGDPAQAMLRRLGAKP